ncbi:MAG: high-potential iron-sulfur protein [Caldimonas sp.]
MSASIPPRRTFVIGLVATGAAMASSRAIAQAALSEKDPQAVALGYVSDATKADTKKFSKYAAGQVCGNCALYQGKAGDAAGNCPLFAGKQVAAKGWCSAWAKKA